MNTFEHITIEGFRRLFSVSVDMRPLTVMIGANGVGKTSFLETFSLLAESAKGQLQSKLSELSGLSLMVTRDKTESVAISLSMPVQNQEPLRYFLKLVHKNSQFYEIGQETLTQQRDRSFNQLHLLTERFWVLQLFAGAIAHTNNFSYIEKNRHDSSHTKTSNL